MPKHSESLILRLCLVLLCLIAAAPASAGETVFGKAQPLKADKPKNDHCAAAYGDGFADLGGTGACVKIGGRVRVDFGASRGNGGPAAPLPSLPDRSSQLGAAAVGFVEADVRKPIGGQTLRVFTRLRAGAGDEFLLHGAAR